MNIGFDLDKIFIDYPPVVPAKLIDYLYKNHNHQLSYRYPSSGLERAFRLFSHQAFFRSAIKENIDFIQALSKNQNHHHFYLISSRYGFLEQLTLTILQKYAIFNLFSKICLNIRDEQPHLFKAKMLNELAIDLYVDDDLELLNYLHQECPQAKLLWYNPRREKHVINGILEIQSLTEISKFIK